MRLEGKVAVITGGASGMGQATALRFLDEGARVVIADYNADNGEKTLGLARDAGHADTARFIRTDVAQEADIVAMVELAASEFGQLDIIFNNAGVGGVVGPVWDIAVEEWDYTFDVLTKGVFLGIKHAARVMKKQGHGGAIINTASTAGLSGGSGPLVYSAAKAAVINLTKSSAVQLAPDRIRVNAICPGAILTGLTDQGNPQQAAQAMDGFQPLAGTRQGRGHRRRGPVSGQPGRRLCHRRSPGRGRWTDRHRPGYVVALFAQAGGTGAQQPCQPGQHRRGRDLTPGRGPVGRLTCP